MKFLGVEVREGVCWPQYTLNNILKPEHELSFINIFKIYKDNCQKY